MVRIVLRVDLGGWTVEFVSELIARQIADVLMLELTRSPSLRVVSARLVDAPQSDLYKP